MLQHALAYALKGWMVFPLHTPTQEGKCSCRKDCKNVGKHPRWWRSIMEHGNKEATTDPERIKTWWGLWPDANIGVRTGQDSGFFMVGPDGEQGIADLASLEAQFGHLPDTAVARSGGGGRHYLFRHPGFRVTNARNHRDTKIDIRGDGGLFVAAPSLHKSGQRYAWEAEREIAEAPAWLLDWIKEPPPPPRPARNYWAPTLSIERRAMALLNKCVGPAVSGQNGHNVTYKGACALVLGYNLSPQDAYELFARWNETCDPPWSEKELWHKLNDANKEQGPRGYLLRNDVADEVVCLDTLIANISKSPEKEESVEDLGIPDDPHEFPYDVLDGIDGFIGAVIKHNLETAMYPQPILAFSGALALMSVLTGRKVAGDYGTRTNCYIIGLAYSGAGKERARQVNDEILFRAGGEKMIGNEGAASSAGLISAIEASPAILFQIDEINDLLATMKNPGKSPYLFGVGTELKKLYTKSKGLYKGNAYADITKAKVIDQPHAVVYGTAVSNGFWQSLTIENVTEGLLGRFMVFDAANYVRRRKVKEAPVAKDTIDWAKWWIDLKPAGGNLADEHPTPHEAVYDKDAEARLDEHLDAIAVKRDGEELSRAAIWSRAGEKTSKLALLFACSNAIGLPIRVTLKDVDRAIRVNNWLTRKMLRKAHDHVSENEQEGKVKRVMRILQKKMTMSEFVRKTQWLRLFERRDILQDLIQNGMILPEIKQGKTKPTTFLHAVTSERSVPDH